MGTLLNKVGGRLAEDNGETYPQANHRAQVNSKPVAQPRVLHLVTSFEAGGTERQFVELLKRLDRQRYDVRLAALRNEGALYEELAASFPEVPEFRLTSFYDRNALRQLRKLQALLRRERIDILHTHGFYDSLFGAMAARLSGTRVIASQRHLKLSDRRAHDWGTRVIHRLAHRVIVNSEAIRDSILARGSCPARKLVVIRNGLYSPVCHTPYRVDAPAHRHNDADPNEAINRQAHEALCRELGLRTDAKLVGMVARLVAVKGHRYFLEAAAGVARRQENVHFVLVGDGPLRSEIKRQASSLGIGDRVHLLGDRRDARRLAAAFDVAALSSLSEGLPNTVMEAMSAGVPVVATAVGGTPELIRDGETGYLVAPAEANALAERILAMLGDSAASRELAKRGREFVNTRFSMHRMVESVETLYEELLAARTAQEPGQKR